MRFVGVLFIASLLIFGCLQNPPQSVENTTVSQPSPTNVTTQIQYKQVTNPFYSIEYPSDWQAIQHSSLTVITSPLDSNGLTASITVNVNKLDNSTNLRNGIENSVDLLKEQFQDFSLISLRNTSLSGTQAFTIEYKASNNKNKYEYTEVFSLQKNYLYEITYGAPEAEYTNHFQGIKHAIVSFSMLNSTQQTLNEQEENAQGASAIEEFTGSWNLASSEIYNENKSVYNLTGSGILLNKDSTWSFGNTSGIWSIDPIDPLDWNAWGISDVDFKREITVYGWDNTTVSGPVEESNGSIEGFWLIYHIPEDNISTGQVEIHFTKFGG